MKNLAKVITAIVLMYTAWSCEPETCSDPVPSMKYTSFRPISADSFELVYEFKDCDGDIGLDQSETNPPYDTGSKYYYNLLIDLYYLENGEWLKYEYPEGSPGLNDRISRLKEDDGDALLEGEIIKKIDESAFNPSLDTVKFSAVLVDRALNESNAAESDIYVLELD
ncbi:MAG: hypothetical protein RI562_04600 [Salibacter sp.]|uniref:hypothetical protein n=1 Tax=Salibacter sp. TaxID=2010995 RepID=UPI002870AA0C|nr:hypothetical protein [Salibacter sp.]MDR9398320.1 hypothetical protein [Salibacter sp.]